MLTNPSDAQIKAILEETRTIALVGASPNPARPSNYVGQFLAAAGYHVIPVNPALGGKTLFGTLAYDRLSDIPETENVDMVDIFRRSDRVLPVVEEAIDVLGPSLKTIWTQIGVVNAQAAELAQRAGLQVVQNRCPKIEIAMLRPELAFARPSV